MKVTFMGAGSTVFAKNVLGDIMLTPALRECDIALYDIDPERLEESYLMVTALNRNINETARRSANISASRSARTHFAGLILL